MITTKKFSKTEIVAYKKSVEYSAFHRLDHMFYNSGFFSRITIQEIFKNAENYISIFMREVNTEVVRYFYNNAEEYLVKNEHSKLSILLEEKPVSDSFSLKILSYLKKRYKSRISVSVIQNIRDASKNDVDVMYFIIADDRMYRLVEDTSNYFGANSFNDAQKVAELKKFFQFMLYLNNTRIC